MLPGLVAQPRAGASSSMREIVHALGLTSGLKVLLDAGDNASYDGSSQTWTDLSGGGYSFLRGTTSGAEGSDPTFNGTAGGRSANDYFSHDGGDLFTLNQAAPSWQSDMHQSGALFTMLFWNYVNNISSLAPTQNFVGAGDALSAASAASAISFTASGSSLRHLSFSVNNETTLVGGGASTLAVNNNAWNMIGVALDMAAGDITFQINGSSETISASFTSPSAVSSHTPLRLGALAADAYGAVSNGCRSSFAGIWSSVLTSTQRGNFWQATRGKFGL